MKGTSFGNDLQWQIETLSESWFQGDKLKGILKVKNLGAVTKELDNSGVSIGLGEIKKIQKKEEGAIKILDKTTLDLKELLPGKESEIDFSFDLSDNAPITDKKLSLYLGYGKNHQENLLQLLIRPHPLFSKISSLMETFYRFKLKEIKATKVSGDFAVEYKFDPPTSKEMASLDWIILSLTKENNQLVMALSAQLNKLDLSYPTTKFKKEKKVVKKELSPKDYSMGKDLFNQDGVRLVLEDLFRLLQ